MGRNNSTAHGGGPSSHDANIGSMPDSRSPAIALGSHGAIAPNTHVKYRAVGAAWHGTHVLHAAREMAGAAMVALLGTLRLALRDGFLAAIDAVAAVAAADSAGPPRYSPLKLVRLANAVQRSPSCRRHEAWPTLSDPRHSAVLVGPCKIANFQVHEWYPQISTASRCLQALRRRRGFMPDHLRHVSISSMEGRDDGFR